MILVCDAPCMISCGYALIVRPTLPWWVAVMYLAWTVNLLCMLGL